MKKMLLSLLATLMAVSVSAQKIAYDKVEDNGLRLISSEAEVFRSFTDKVVLSLAVSAAIKDENVDYFIDVTLKSSEPISAPASARMLVKTQKGTVLSLDGFFNHTIADNIGDIQSIGGIIVHTFTILLPYEVTEDDINTLRAEGVAKVRIELDGNKSYEKTWKKDKIGAFIGKEFDLVKVVSATDKRDSFDDDF